MRKHNVGTLSISNCGLLGIRMFTTLMLKRTTNIFIAVSFKYTPRIKQRFKVVFYRPPQLQE